MRAVELEVVREMEAFTAPANLPRKVADEFQRDAALSWRNAIGALAAGKP